MIQRDIYLAITIDTECDKGAAWQTRHPLAFDSVNHGVPETLMPLFDSFGIKPTFLLSPEVIQDEPSCTILSNIKNCELGTHLHGEFIEPQADWNNAITNMAQLIYQPDIERQKLENLTRLFEQRFSYRPRSFRAGRFGISSHTLEFLVELGYEVDSSVTPFWTHDFDQGYINNFWGAPLFPYYPSSHDARKSGRLKIVEVPVTIMNPFFLKWPRWLLRRMDSRSIFHKKILPRLGIKIPKTTWLRPQRSSAQELIDVARTMMKYTPKNKPIVLNMMYHSVEIVPDASPYAANDAEVGLIVQSQQTFFDWLFKNFSVKTIGLSDVPSTL